MELLRLLRIAGEASVEESHEESDDESRRSLRGRGHSL